jgi:hypothetical protein
MCVQKFAMVMFEKQRGVPGGLGIRRVELEDWVQKPGLSQVRASSHLSSCESNSIKASHSFDTWALSISQGAFVNRSASSRSNGSLAATLMSCCIKDGLHVASGVSIHSFDAMKTAFRA